MLTRPLKHLLLLFCLIGFTVHLASQDWNYIESLEDDLDLCGLPTCTSSYMENSAGTDEPSSTLINAVKGWMGKLPDSMHLRDISIPGTHDSGATIGGVGPEAQNWSIREQLDGGIRFIDIRCVIDDDETGFDIYHGIFGQDLTFDEVMNDVQDFLTDNPTEGVIMRVKKEHGGDDVSDFVTIWNSYTTAYPIFTDTISDPTLGDIRGQVYVMREFLLHGNTAPGPNNIGATFYNNSLLDLQNEYAVYASSIAAAIAGGVHIVTKEILVKEYMDKAGDPSNNNWIINYLSGAFGMTPEAVAWHTNDEAFQHLDTKPSKTNVGTMIMDFPGEGLIYRIIKTNFDHYRKREFYVQIDCHQPFLPNSGTDDKLTVRFYNDDELMGTAEGVPSCGAFTDVRYEISAIVESKPTEITHVIIETNGEDAFFLDEVFLKKPVANIFQSDKIIDHWGDDGGSGWVLSRDTDESFNGVDAEACLKFTVGGDGGSANCTPGPPTFDYYIQIDCSHGDIDGDTGTEDPVRVSFFSASGFQGSVQKVPDCGTFSDADFEISSIEEVTHVLIEALGGDALYMDEVYLMRPSGSIVVPDDEIAHWGMDNGAGYVLSTDPNDHFGDDSVTSSCFEFRVDNLSAGSCRPTAICNSAITKELDENGNLSIGAGEVDNGSVIYSGNLTLSLSQNTFDCSDIGNNLVTLTVSDGSKTSTCHSIVRVVDITSPLASCKNNTVYLNEYGYTFVTPDIFDNGSSDACQLDRLELETTFYTCEDIGWHSITLRAADQSGNVGICIATVTVMDDIPPEAVCTDKTVYLNATGSATVPSHFIENGSSDNCGFIGGMSLSKNTFTCADVGIPQAVTMTVSDGNGNSSTCTATVTVVDDYAPEVFCLPGPLEVFLDENGQASITPADIYVSPPVDACGIQEIVGSWQGADNVSLLEFDCVDIGDHPVTLTVTDVNGNSSTCTSFVRVEDNVAPNAICQDMIVQLDENGEGTVLVSEINNGSNDACGVESTVGSWQSAENESSINFDCGDVGDQVVTLTVTDVNDNSSTCTSVVTVEDQVAPIAICQGVTVHLDENGEGSVQASEIDNGSNDACGIQSIVGSLLDFTCDDVGDQVVTLTVTDVNGNSSTCVSTVSVYDNIAPVALCQDVTAVLDPTGNMTVTASQINDGSNDACGVELVVSSGQSAVSSFLDFDCEDIGEHPVTLIVTDPSGNSSSCSSVITVEKGTALPINWDHEDVGPANGDAVYDPCEEFYTVNSSGYSNPFSDTRHFAYQQICNSNMEIVVHVNSIDHPGGAGIEIREDLSPNARSIALKTQLSSMIWRMIRTTTGGLTQNQQIPRFGHTWLKIVRNGNNFTGYSSTNGTQWTMAFSLNLNFASCVYVGLFTESINANSTTTSTFDHVSVNVNSPNGNLMLPGGITGEVASSQMKLHVSPNPFSDRVNVSFDLPEDHYVNLNVFTLSGQQVATILNTELASGNYTRQWDGTNSGGQQLTAGIYLIRFQMGNEVITEKIVLMR